MQYSDISLNDFQRINGEKSDSPRIARAVSAAKNKIVFIPPGIYELTEPIEISNHVSLLMHKSACLKVCKKMDYAVKYDGGAEYSDLIVRHKNGNEFDDLNIFIKGGEIDGNGMASCLSICNYHHFTLSEITLRNGLHYGLKVGEHGYGFELIADNVYCKCNIPGLSGNTGISTNDGDSHYTDCIIVDYTTGFEIAGGANRVTRCHIWGGIIPPKENGAMSEMLENSTAFRITGVDTVLNNCYADTAEIGYYISGARTRLFGCSQYNNMAFGLVNETAIYHKSGTLIVSGCCFSGGDMKGKYTNTIVYKKAQENDDKVIWRDNICTPWVNTDGIPNEV